jgi:hypothetical protein
MELRKIESDREMLVGFYVSDMVRGEANVGLTFVEADALKLVVDYERTQGRELVGAGSNMAASRMLDNAYGADEGSWELAKLMVSDLAFQRHAQAVVEAGEAFARDGTMPADGTFDSGITKYVIPDLAEDEEVRADWKAMAEGRYHDVSRMYSDIHRDGVRNDEFLPEGASTWLYDNMPKEEEWSPTRSSGLDALQMAEMLEPQDREAMAAPEAAASLAAGLKEDMGLDLVESSDRMDFTKLVYIRDEGFTEADVKAVRDYAENFAYDTSDIRLTREGHLTVDVTGVSEYPPRQPEFEPGFNDVQEWLAGEPARHEWTEEEHAAKVGGYLGQYRHGKMMEEGRDPTDLVASVRVMHQDGADLPDDVVRGAERLDRMIAAEDPRTKALAHSLADAVMGDRGLDAGTANWWAMMDERAMPLSEKLVEIGEQDKGNWVERAIGETAGRAAGAGVEMFDAVRLDMATGPEADMYRPFVKATREELGRASNEIQLVQDKVRYADPTIGTDPSLERAMLLLADAGVLPKGADSLDENRFMALERAYARAETHETRKGPMSPNDKARMIVFDVATQEEARGLAMGSARGEAVSRPAEKLVESMGIRTLHQEKLSDQDLSMASVGRFEDVSEYHRAGLDLGLSWARDGVKDAAEMDARMSRLANPSIDAASPLHGLSSGGVVAEAQREGEFAAALNRAEGRGIAAQARGLDQTTTTRSKGSLAADADVLRTIHGIGRDKGRE